MEPVKARIVKVNADMIKDSDRIWDNFRPVCEVIENHREKFCIGAATRAGFRYINVREFYLRQSDNTWRPSRYGITIPLCNSADKGKTFIYPMSDFVDAILQAAAIAESLDLYDPEHAVLNIKEDYSK